MWFINVIEAMVVFLYQLISIDSHLTPINYYIYINLLSRMAGIVG